MKSLLRCRKCGAEYIYQGDYFGELRAWDWLKEHKKICKGGVND